MKVHVSDDVRSSRAARACAPLRRLLRAAARLAVLPAAAAIATAALVAPVHKASGAEYNWISTTNFNWGVPANWYSDTSTSYPSVAGDTAIFDVGTYMALDGKTITRSGTYYLGHLRAIGMDQEGDFYRLTISGNTFYMDSGSTARATIEVFAKLGLTIASSVSLQGSTEGLYIHNASQLGGELTFNSTVNVGSKYVIMDAQFGSTITTKAQIYASYLSKQGAGTLRLEGTPSQYKDFHFNGGTVDVSNVSGSTFFGNNASDATLRVKHHPDYGNTILIKDLPKSASVANIIFEDGASLSIGRDIGFNENVKPSFSFTGASLQLSATTGNTLNVAVGTNVIISNTITGGALVKTGPGSLVLQNTRVQNLDPAYNSFSDLMILGGKVTAQGIANTTVNIGVPDTSPGSFLPSPVGAGSISISGPTSYLEVTAYSGDLTAINFGSQANVTLNDLATFSLSRAQTVNFNAGNINFGGYAAYLVLDANTVFQNTNFQSANNATLVLKKNAEFSSASGGLFAQTTKLEFAPAADTTQLVTLSGGSNFTHAGSILVSGPGVTSFAPAITSISSVQGITIGGGTLGLTKSNQIGAATTLTFDNTAATPGTLLLNGYSQALYSVIITQGSQAVFDLGGSPSTSTSLQIDSFSDDFLRIRNWNQGDFVHQITALSEGDVWFYGYEIGARVEAGYYVPNAARLSSSFDNTRDGGFNVPSDWNWYNPLNWVGDDVFKIPNAPGVTASIQNGTGALGNIKGKTISLGSNETTVGTLITEVGDGSSSTTTALIITGTGGAKLIFDSGEDDVAAKWTATTQSSSDHGTLYDNVVINVPVVLTSNLEVNNTVGQPPGGAYGRSFNRDRFGGTVSGSGTITKNGSGRLEFATANPSWTGGIILNQGGIYLGEDGALGTGPIEINNTGGATNAIISSSTYTQSSARIVITNEVSINGDFTALGLTFAHPTLSLDKVYTLAVNPYTNSAQTSYFYTRPWYNPSVVIKSKVVDAPSQQGGFKIDGNAYNLESYIDAVRFDDPNNSFSGGLSAGHNAYIVAIVGKNQDAPNYGMVIGASAPGQNYFGTGPLKITIGSTVNNYGNYGRFHIVTEEDGRNVIVRGNGVDNTISSIYSYTDGLTYYGSVRFSGRGEVTIESTAKVNFAGYGSRIEFATAKNTISGGVFDFSGSYATNGSHLSFLDQSYNDLDAGTGEYTSTARTAESTNEIKDGTFTFSGTAYIKFDASSSGTTNTISGGTFNFTDSSSIRFLATGASAQTNLTISGDSTPTHFNLSLNSYFHIGEVAQTGGTVGSYFERVAHFKGGTITVSSSGSNNSAISLGNGGVWSFEGGTIVNPSSLNLEFKTRSIASIRATSGNGTVVFHSVTKENLGVATIEDTIDSIRAGSYEITGGTLRSTRDLQLQDANGAHALNPLSISGGGVLDSSNVSNKFQSLTVGESGGSFVLGSTGKLSFDSLASWGVTTDLNPTFFIQGSGGGWGDSSPNYVSFVTEPSLSPAQLTNIVFTGYESGAKVSPLINGNYYLQPADTAIPTSEWTGQSQPNFTGVNWSETNNWFSGGGNAFVPGSSGGLKSATFRDIDERLGEDVSGTATPGNLNGKKILVDGAYTLAHLNIETNTLKFSLELPTNPSGDEKLIFADDGDVTAQIKHSGLSTLTINAPIDLNSNLNLVLNAKNTDGYVILAGQITGDGGIIKTRSIADSTTLGGDLRITGDNNTFKGGFTWDDNIAHLQIRHTNASTPLGTGLVTFGSSATSKTIISGHDINGPCVNVPGGLLLYGDLTLQSYYELGQWSSGNTYLRIDASESSTGILLSPGDHVISNGDSYRKQFRLLGPIHDQTPGNPASLTLDDPVHPSLPYGYISLFLNGDSDFSGGVTIKSRNNYLYLGHNNALGIGPFTISNYDSGSWYSYIYAWNPDGDITLTGGTSESRRITNQLIFQGNASGDNCYTCLYGDLMFDRNPGETWTLDLDLLTSSQLRIRPDSGALINPNSFFGKIGPAFGENFVISGGADKKLRFDYSSVSYYIMRFFNSGSTYSGGTDINGSTTYNFYVVLGADSVMDGNTLQSGPFGTGSITANGNITFVPWSTDPTKTTRTLSNEITLGSNIDTISVLKTNEVEVENCANTIILNSTQQLILPRAMNFSVGEGAVLQIDSQITGSYPLTKIGVGAVVLTNNNNIFSQANVNAGALIGRAATGDVLMAPPGTSGRAGYFGAGNAVVIDNTVFDVQADNYATGRAALVVETPGVVTVSGTSSAQPFYLVGQGAAFIVGGGEGGTGMGFNGAGILRFGGGSTIHGRVAPDATDPLGWLVADRMIQDTSYTTTTIGLNLRANHLEIGNSGAISMQAPSLLSGVADLHFTSGEGTLNLAGKSQALRANMTVVGSGGAVVTRYSTLGADAGAEGHIVFTNETLSTEADPILFTFGRIGDYHAGEIHFDYWQGNTENGLGPTRVVTTGHRRGELVPKVHLNPPTSTDTLGIAIVMLNSDGQNVLLPLGDQLVWSGALAALGVANSTEFANTWEGTFSQAGGPDPIPTISNWDDTKTSANVRWPGALGMIMDIGNVVTFDTVVPNNDKWNWSTLVIPIMTDGFSATPHDDTSQVALGGSILVTGPNVGAHITLASGLGLTGASNTPRLTLDNGEAGNVSVLINTNARLSINLPIFLFSESEGTERHNNLIINTAGSDSIVELNETITGSLGSVLYKNGAGHLYIRGDNDPAPPSVGDTAIPGLSGGIVLEGGHLYIGNDKSVGSYNDGARITFRGGTIHPLEDWYVPDEGVGAAHEPGHYKDITPPDPANPKYEDRVLPNNYRFAGDFAVAGDATLSFFNNRGIGNTSTATGEVTANSTVTILNKDGKLVLDGTTIGSASATTYTVTFKGPGDVLIRKSGETGAGIHLIANASATDVAEATSGGGAPPLVEIASPSVRGNVSNLGYGALKLTNYATTGGGTTAGTVTNSGPGTLEIATTGNSYGDRVRNTGTGTTTVNGAGNTFAGGITTSGGGTFVINAANNANGNISVLGSSKLELNAGVGYATSPITASIYGKLLVNATANTSGSLKTGSTGISGEPGPGSVTVYDGGIIEFIVAENGGTDSHGSISTGTLTAQSGSALKVSFDANFNTSKFGSGYTVNLFDTPNNPDPDYAPIFIDNSGWAQGQNVTITLGGNAIDLGTDLAWRFDRLAEEGEIYIGDRILPGLYWDGVAGQVWNLADANIIWRHSEFYETNREYAVTNGGELAFTAGERAIFDKRLRVDTPPEEPLTLNVQVSNSGNAIEVHSLLVLGNGSDFVFDGDEIKVVGPFTAVGGTGQYPGADPGITVGNEANATFKNKFTTPFLRVENSGTVTLVYESGENSSNGGSDKFSFAGIDSYNNSDNIKIELAGTNDILVLKKEGTTEVAPSFVISGRGIVEKTGPGVISFVGAHTYNGTTVGGATRVKGGRLNVLGGLGNKGAEFAYSVGSSGELRSKRNYNGAIEIETGATLSFVNKTNSYDGNGQRLGGHIGHGYGNIGADGYTHAASTDGTLDFNGGYTEIAGERNSFQGNIIVRDEGVDNTHTYLKISGGIGTVAETFDGGTPFAATYYHNRYAGNITIHKDATVEFSNNNDYQYLSGNLSGQGILEITGSMPVYYAGNASNFSGSTYVGPNSTLHLYVPAGQQYGGDGPGGSYPLFSTRSASTLYVGGGGKLYVGIFLMETNSTLVVNPGKFIIQGAGTLGTAVMNFGSATDNVTLVFRLAQEDVNEDVAKLALQNSSGAGVELSGGKTLRADAFGYIPQPSQSGTYDFFTLMSGLDTGTMGIHSMAGSTDREKGEALALLIFNQNELEIMNSRFSLFFTVGGNLMLEQTSYTGIPEPATYGLFSGVFIAAFALIGRRRKRRLAAAA